MEKPIIMAKQEEQQPAKKSRVMEQLKSLQQEDETLHSIFAVDVWALAKTMDEFYPGFWSAFMKNREKAFKKFMSEVKQRSDRSKRPPFLR